jgi:hypothetical protein
MLVQTIMQVTSDGGVRDIAFPFNDESHKEWLWACLDIACEFIHFFHGI